MSTGIYILSKMGHLLVIPDSAYGVYANVPLWRSCKSAPVWPLPHLISFKSHVIIKICKFAISMYINYSYKVNEFV